jgi:glycosyltransferase involved in cell wall biosynthesis
VRRNKIKAVFACSFRSYYLAKIVSSVVPLLVVFWIRDIAIMQTITKRFVFKVLSRKDWLIANSQAGLQAHSKPGRERTAVVYGGVEFPVICDKLHSRKAIGLPGDGFLLLYAADFKPYKDHATLIRAFKRLAPKWPTLYLGLCGRHGSLQKEVIDPILGESLGRDRVWLFGARRDIDALFSAADIYVHPCFVECFGNAVVEAMAAGLPVVVANGGGLAEVTGDSGILFEPRNDQELSDAINRLLESETERRIYSVKGKNRATQEFGADAYAVRFLRTAKTIFDREYREDG